MARAPNKWNRYVKGTCSPGYRAQQATRASKKKAKISASRKRRRLPTSLSAMGIKRPVPMVVGQHIRKKRRQ